MANKRPALQPAEETSVGPTRLGKENNPSLNFHPDFTKSRIPVPSKSKPVPDFKKLHDNWKAKFHQGKAVSKKASTRPCPFSLSQKGDRFQVLRTDNLLSDEPWGSNARKFPNECSAAAEPHALRGGGPLKELHLGSRNETNTMALREPPPANGLGEQDFRTDSKALATILDNVGLTGTAGPAGKYSLCMRVPVTAGSRAAPRAGAYAPVGRMSAYAAPLQGSHHAVKPMPRPSILAEQGAVKRSLMTEQRPHLGLSSVQWKSAVALNEISEGSSKAAQGRLNMGVVSAGVEAKNCGSEASAPAVGVQTAAQVSLDRDAPVNRAALLPIANSASFQRPLSSGEYISKADENNTATDFVSDPSALASILSNTGLKSTSFGAKMSLAQRVPVRGTAASSLCAVGSSRALGGSVYGPRCSVAPRLDFPRSSCMPRLGFMDSDVRCTPQRLAGVHQEEMRPSPLGSAQRVPDKNPLRFRSVQKWRPVFPKTPQARALEEANRLANAEPALGRDPEGTTQPTNGTNPKSSSKSRGKWSDGGSPRPSLRDTPRSPEDEEAICLENVAVRLFSEADGSSIHQNGEGDSKKTKTQILQDLAKLQHIAQLSKQLQQEMASIASRVFPDLPLPLDPALLPDSIERLTLSKSFPQNGENCLQLSSASNKLSSYPTAAQQDLQKGTTDAQRGASQLGIQQRLPLASVTGVDTSKAQVLSIDFSLENKFRTGVLPPGHTAFTAFSTLKPQSGHNSDHCLLPGLSSTAHLDRLSSYSAEHLPHPASSSVDCQALDGLSSAEHLPLPTFSSAALVSLSSPECQPFPRTSNSECHSLPGSSIAEHHPLLGFFSAEQQPIPLSSNTECQPLLGSSSAECEPLSSPSSAQQPPLPGSLVADQRTLAGMSGVSHTEHCHPSMVSCASTLEHQPTVAGASLLRSAGGFADRPLDTTTTFSSQGSVCSNLQIQPSQVYAGNAFSLGAPMVRPVVPRPSLKTMFQHLHKAFQEACLDDECHFYLSKPLAACPDAALRSETSCRNPLATMLEQEEAMHFSPIKSPFKSPKT